MSISFIGWFDIFCIMSRSFSFPGLGCWKLNSAVMLQFAENCPGTDFEEQVDRHSVEQRGIHMDLGKKNNRLVSIPLLLLFDSLRFPCDKIFFLKFNGALGVLQCHSGVKFEHFWRYRCSKGFP